MISKKYYLHFFLSLALALTACSGVYKHEVRFNPSEPLRVAVLPFAFVDKKGGFINPNKDLLVDNVPLLSSKLEDSPPVLVRKFVQSELGKTSLDLVSPGLVDAQLSHHGFTLKGGDVDLPKLFAVNGAELCEKLLACDAILYGKVTKWDRTYLGLQTENEVGIDLKLVSAKDGKVLYEAQSDDSEGRGITKGPTGFSNLVIEPVKGLSNDIIAELAGRIVQKTISPLTAASRPEFLSSSPPAIFASAHDARDGIVSQSTPLTVLIFGSPAANATFSIGNAISNVPMTEKDPGHYYGQFIPLQEDKLSNETVTVKLTDNFGRSTQFALEKIHISTR
jgi:hypothetical protein